jgi:hypothetical protein
MTARGRYVAVGLVGALTVGGPTVLAPPATGGSDDLPAEVAVTLRDEAIDESSGLVLRGDSLLTVNDSGDGPHLYEVSLRTGRTVGVTTFAGEDPMDVEALAAGPDQAVWVGDIGDNRRSRGSVRLYRFVPPPGGGEVSATSFDLVYPDRPHDAETLLVHPGTGRVLVVTKRFAGGGAVYRAPRRLRPGRTHELERLAPVAGMVTDGTFLPGGRRVLLRTYGTASVYTYPGFEKVATFALPSQEQGEAVAVGDDGRVYLTSEGALSDVLVLDLPAAPSAGASPPRPDPAAPDGTAPDATAPERDAPSTGHDPPPWRGLEPAGLLLAMVGAGLVVSAGLWLRAALRRGRRRR